MIQTALSLLSFFIINTSIYTFSMPSIEGKEINFNDYRGKKILLVNTASEGPYSNQYASLEALHQKYKDRLVIIAFPSNSFGHETKDNNAIKTFVHNSFNIHFRLAAKTDVLGENKTALYRWLSLASENGVMNGKPKGDFFKFLIDESGNMMGFFDGSIDPMNDKVQNAIQE